MSGGITVQGGADGIAAHFDDLLAMAALLSSAADAAEQAWWELTRPPLAWPLTLPSSRDALELEAAWCRLAGPLGELTLAIGHLNGLAAKLRWAASVYRDGDDTVLDSILSGFGHTLWGLADFGIGDFSGGLHQLAGARTGLADLLALVRRWHAEKRTVLAALHDLEMVRANFPDTLLLARGAVAWGPTAQVLSAENLAAARQMCEAFDDAAPLCADTKPAQAA